MKILPYLFAASLSVTLWPMMPVSAASQNHAATTIDWRKDNNLEAAFAEAKASNKPLFLYWGAVWCPPCNQVKATIFNRQEFIDKSRHFIPVYLDGDSPGAQKYGTQFKVRGYPTMILMKPDGTEITRLPGEVDAGRYLQVLTLALNSSRSAQDIIKLALAGGKGLKAEDWSLLADYSWDDPQQKLVPVAELPASLLKLSQTAPQADEATRLFIRAMVASAKAKPELKGVDKTQALERIQKTLKDERLCRDNLDQLTGYTDLLLEYLSPAKSKERKQLSAIWHAALVKLAEDSSLSKTDRVSALNAQVILVKQDQPQADKAFLSDLQKRISQIEQATNDAYERQSVVSSAAYTLANAGLLNESDKLLKAELKRSHSPYYFMSSLASNARKRGDNQAAANWYEQAYNSSQGPATRLQWGSNYVMGLIDLLPQQDQRVEQAAQSVLSEAAKIDNPFYERNRAYLEKMGKKLVEWNKDGKHQASMNKISAQLESLCGKLPANDAQKGVCQNLLSKS